MKLSLLNILLLIAFFLNIKLRDFNEKKLNGKKIAVLVETEYIPEEVNYYQKFFGDLGAEVEFISYLWGDSSRELVSDVTNPSDIPENLNVKIDVSDADVKDYAAVIMCANYCAVRFREIPPQGSFGGINQLQTAPAVKFFVEAMKYKNIIKGAMCHALWILTPAPELLKGRKVACHTVVLADIHNAGAEYVTGKYVAVDNDLITARSIKNLKAYATAIAEAIPVKLSAR